MMEHVPDVLDVLVAVEIPNVKAHEDSKKQIAPLCTAYGVLMLTRWKELSLIQKMNSILLSTGHATERVSQYQPPESTLSLYRAGLYELFV